MNVSTAEHRPQGYEQNHDKGRVCILSFQERLGIRRIQEPICIGVPFPQGVVPVTSNIAVLDGNGKGVSCQTQILSSWADESAKWVLVEFLVDAEPFQNEEYHVTVCEEKPPHFQGGNLMVHEGKDDIHIDTGPSRFHFSGTALNPLFHSEMREQSGIKVSGPSVVLVDEYGQTYTPAFSSFLVETQGPVRATVKLEGSFQRDHKVLARFIARLSFFAGSGVVEMKCTLHNPNAAQHLGGLWDLGDQGSFMFQDLTLEFPFLWETAKWKTTPLESFKDCEDGHLEIYQDSSGGQNWNSTNHCNRDGKIVPAFSGYQVKVNDQLVEAGPRATPTLSVTGNRVIWDGVIENFWQNFPKAMEIRPSGLMFRLFPKQCQDLFELQGGEQKTHTVFFQVSSPEQQAGPLTWVHDRLVPRLLPDWYVQSGAVPYLTPRAWDDQKEYLALIDSAVDGQNTFFDRREIIDEYGWRNFGDIYGDHEAVGHTGPTPKVSHYNNQYDVINGALIEFFRSGDLRWYELMRDLARHVIDIDLYHTTEDRPEYNGGMFWHTDHYFDAGTASHRAYSKINANPENPAAYGGGPSNEQNYTTGLLHYYYLSGDPLAYEAVLSLANWVLRMDEGSRPWLRYLDPRPTGLASSSAGRDYHGPGRGAGNSINALLDAYSLVSNREYVEKAEALIRRCIHPHDNIEERNFEDVEYRWSYTVFLQILGKYLDFKAEHREIDTMYAYAQASLLHYAQWMVAHEIPYQQVIHKVKIPTETWPAQDIRKSNVFKFAAKYSEGLLRDTFLQKSDEFFQASVRDLRSYATSHLTRPIALLLVNGYMHASFATHPDQSGVLLKECPDFGNPQPFSPQLSEVYRLKEWVDECRRKIQLWVSSRKNLKRRIIV